MTGRRERPELVHENKDESTGDSMRRDRDGAEYHRQIPAIHRPPWDRERLRERRTLRHQPLVWQPQERQRDDWRMELVERSPSVGQP